MSWHNTRLMDPVAQDQRWKITVKPNLATLLIAILIVIPIAIYKPVYLLGIVPVFAVIGVVWWRTANKALEKMKASEPQDVIFEQEPAQRE